MTRELYWRDGATITAVAFAFYLLTLAPTVLWGDDAYFQRIAPIGTTALRPDGGGHWLWMVAAHRFAQLPFGTVAYRVNLLSAVAAGGTLALVYAALSQQPISRWGRILGVAALAVSHTFWMHAVRAEVYTLFTLFMAAHLLLWLWRDAPFWPLAVSAALFGVTLLAHQMGVLLLPAFAFLLWRRRLSGKQFGLVALLFALGLIPFFAVLQMQIGAKLDVGLWETAVRYFTTSGDDFRSAMFDLSAQSVVRDGALWIGFLGFQFFGAGLLLAAIGAYRAFRTTAVAVWGSLLIVYLTVVAFAFSYRVSDQFVFYLPSYLVVAVFIGFGQTFLEERWAVWRKTAVRLATLTLICLLPILLYYGTATYLDRNQINPLDIRTLPGRDPYAFLLWPSKANYRGAETFARDALESLPPDSVLIAEHTPFNPLLYMQRVAQVRPDVRLIQISPGGSVAAAVERAAGANGLGETAVFVADNNPRYYNFNQLGSYQLLPYGNIYQLMIEQTDE